MKFSLRSCFYFIMLAAIIFAFLLYRRPISRIGEIEGIVMPSGADLLDTEQVKLEFIESEMAKDRVWDLNSAGAICILDNDRILTLEITPHSILLKERFYSRQTLWSRLLRTDVDLSISNEGKSAGVNLKEILERELNGKAAGKASPRSSY